MSGTGNTLRFPPEHKVSVVKGSTFLLLSVLQYYYNLIRGKKEL